MCCPLDSEGCVCVSSAIKGVELECVYPEDPSQASAYVTRRSLRHVIFTAETHNFPTGPDLRSPSASPRR